MIAQYGGFGGSVRRRRRSSVKDFLALEVPAVPPIEEQRRIAAVLDRGRCAPSQTATGPRHARHPHPSGSSSRCSATPGAALASADLCSRSSALRYDRYKTAPELRATRFGSRTWLGGVRELQGHLRRCPSEHRELDRRSLARGDLLARRSNREPRRVGRCVSVSQRKMAAATPIRRVHSYLIRAR